MSCIRKFGYPGKNDKPDRLNFGGRHVVGVRCPATGLTMRLAQRNDSLRLLRAFAAGAMYYDPGIKVLAHSHQRPRTSRSARSEA